MKKTAALLLALCLLLAAVPAMADGAYEFLKTTLETTMTDSTAVDVSDKVTEIQGTTVLLINIESNFISIAGRNASNRYECMMWLDLEFTQVAGYGAALLEYFDTIDNARTTAKAFAIMVTYGEEEDDFIVVNNARDAAEIAAILKGDD